MRNLALLLAALVACPAAAGIGPIGTDYGIYMLDGTLVPGQQPDGNTIFFRAPEGWIVVDTGRHVEHTKQILDYARPVKAVINTHWHLDHTGGNVLIRERWPSVRIYASDAIHDALKGFLANYAKQLKPGPELALIQAGDKLAPTDVIDVSGPRTIAGRKLEVNLEKNAVTAGDVWIFDPKTKVLVAGDLVTLPVPFFDTACPKRWQEALDHLAAKDFGVLIPGHGFILFRHSFERYRTAFGNLLACAASSQTNAQCADAWLKDADFLVEKDQTDYARAALDYYLTNVLRPGAKTQCVP